MIEALMANDGRKERLMVKGGIWKDGKADISKEKCIGWKKNFQRDPGR